jgi:N-acetylglutamate synthase-like GNAT family acetyltransferase
MSSNLVKVAFRPGQRIAEVLRELADQADAGEIKNMVFMGETETHWVYRTGFDHSTEGASVLGAVHLLAHQLAADLAE